MKIRFSPLYLLLLAALLILGQGAVAAWSLVALLMHEGAHALVAARYGFRLDVVKLQPYGAQLDGDLSGVSPQEEIWIALAGPICSGLLTAVTAALWWGLPSAYDATKTFAIANTSIAVVNLLPVYPMDGGRVLYAALCTRLQDARALRIVSVVGLTVGVAVSVSFCVGLFFGFNLTLAMLGVFMISSAIGGVRGSRYAAVSALTSRDRERSVGVRMTAIPSSKTLLEALKLLDRRHYAMLAIVDRTGAVLTMADEARLTSWSLAYDPGTPLAEILSASHHKTS